MRPARRSCSPRARPGCTSSLPTRRSLQPARRRRPPQQRQCPRRSPREPPALGSRPGTIDHVSDITRRKGSDTVKRGLAEMLSGGVIMDVVNVEQAKLAEDAGAVAVMALERVP